MQIVPGQFSSGSIIVNEKIPSLSVGRLLVATVLSRPKGGNVLVSLFGRKTLVETTIPLHKGQVLNLKIHAVSPRIILKPVQPSPGSQTVMKGIKNLVEDLVGTFGKTPVKSFTAEEILQTFTKHSLQEPAFAQFVSTLMDQINLHPQALAYLFIPLVQEDSHSHARISIEKQDQAYIIHFEINTDHLGQMECTARLDDAIDVEIRTSSQETADFIQEHIYELYTGLEPLGVRSCEVVLKHLGGEGSPGVDVLV